MPPSIEHRLAVLEAAMIELRRSQRKTDRRVDRMENADAIAKGVADAMAERNVTERNGRFSRREQAIGSLGLVLLALNTAHSLLAGVTW